MDKWFPFPLSLGIQHNSFPTSTWKAGAWQVSMMRRHQLGLAGLHDASDRQRKSRQPDSVAVLN